MKMCPLEENYASLLIVDYDKTLFFYDYKMQWLNKLKRIP